MCPGRGAGSAVDAKEKWITQHYVCCLLMNCISKSAPMGNSDRARYIHNKARSPDIPTGKMLRILSGKRN